MSIAHDIVGDVHGGGAGLVDEGTLVQPSEHLGWRGCQDYILVITLHSGKLVSVSYIDQ